MTKHKTEEDKRKITSKTSSEFRLETEDPYLCY